jgi:DNA-binding MarR family transcriptional regulator
MKSSSLAHRITSFRNQFMNLGRRLRREAQSDDRSWTRLQLLGAISRAGDQATPTLLAESESMRSSNLAAALRELETDGLIARTPDAHDGRKVRVQLTPLGCDVLRENIERRERWLAEAVEEALTQEERALLFKAGELLDRIAAYSGSAASQASPRRAHRVGPEIMATRRRSGLPDRSSVCA